MGHDMTKREHSLTQQGSGSFADGIESAAALVEEMFDDDHFPIANRRRISGAIRAIAAPLPEPDVPPAAWRWECAYGGEELVGEWQVSTAKPSRPGDATDFVCEPLYGARKPKSQAPEDWQLVPREVSREMREAAMHYLLGTGNIYAREETVVVETTTPGDVWKAMLGAAPASPQPDVRVKPTIAVGASTIAELYAGRTVESDHVFMKPTDDLAAIVVGIPRNSCEPTEDMLVAGEEAYHSAPRDEDGCTAMASAFKAMLRAAKPSPETYVAGWQPMETAPLNGKHCILAIPSGGGFVYSIQGAYMHREWHNAADIKSEPLAWMPNILLPDEYCPWTEAFKARASLLKLEASSNV